MHWCEFKFSLFFLSLCLLLHCIQCVKHCSISLNENFKSISSILCHSYTERLLYQVSKCLNWFSLSLSTNNNERFNSRKKKEKCLNFLNFQLFIRKKKSYSTIDSFAKKAVLKRWSADSKHHSMYGNYHTCSILSLVFATSSTVPF